MTPETAISTPPAPSSGGEMPGVLPSALVPASSGLAAVDPAPVSPLKKAIKPPKDSKTYKVAMAYVALKAQGLKLQAISDQLGIPKDTITTYVKRATNKGWLRPKELDVEDQITFSMPDQVVRNVGEFLEQRDKEVTIQAAKGLGIFQQHQAVKVDGTIQNNFALRVDVTLPESVIAASPIQVRPGSVGGQPAIDAEIVEEE